MAGHIGFNASDSTAVHKDMIARLSAAGIPIADALIPLRKAALSGARPYFETDPRPTPQGTRILAASVGALLADHPNLKDVTREVYVSTQGADFTLASSMRAQLQAACQSPIPKVITPSFTTARQTGAFAATGASFGATQGNRLVVLGTEITGTPALNLAGFLSETTGLETLTYGLPGGGPFAAISSYLTSADFQAAPPRVLVWEFPVSASLANHGDQPLAEFIAAAGGACRAPLATTRSPTGDRLRADLSQVRPDAQLTLSLDTGGAALPYVRFHFTGNDGLVRSRSIYRHPDQILTGQFFMPLSGLNATGLRGVEIEGAGAFGLQARLTACS
jgi:alginate biosynthesis protein AlgX